jgi:hypothetical protein
MLKFFLLIFILLCPLVLVAQEDNVVAEPEPASTQGSVTVMPSAPEEIPVENTKPVVTEEDAALNEIEAKKAEFAKKQALIQKSVQNIEAAKNKSLVQMPKKEQLIALAEMNLKMGKENVKKNLQASHIPVLGYLFKTFPVTLDIGADFFSDKDALVKFFAMLDKKEDLKYFGIIATLLFIFFFWFKKHFLPKDRFLIRMIVSIVFSAGTTVVYFLVFNYFFEENISPVLSIIKRHLFS